jgi:hypothetical protein
VKVDKEMDVVAVAVVVDAAVVVDSEEVADVVAVEEDVVVVAEAVAVEEDAVVVVAEDSAVTHGNQLQNLADLLKEDSLSRSKISIVSPSQLKSTK